MIVGLTGGYCAGKSTVANILSKQSFLIINVDALGHQALELEIENVKTLLGNDVVTDSGKPNRKAIAKKVFSDAEILKKYEAIIHPTMNELVKQCIKNNSNNNICIDAAILYKLPSLEYCDFVIEVRAPLYLRIIRGTKRDGINTIAILKRIASQKQLWKKTPMFSKQIYIVYNKGSDKKLADKINNVLTQQSSLLGKKL